MIFPQFISSLEVYDGPFKECHPKPEISQQDLIDVLAKIKKQMLTKSLRVVDFLRDYDRHRKGEILDEDFRRGVDNSGIKITPREMDIVCEMYDFHVHNDKIVSIIFYSFQLRSTHTWM